MKAKVILKKYCDEKSFEWNFDDVKDIFFLEETIEINFIEDKEDEEIGIITSVKIPKENIEEISFYEF